MPEVLSSPSPPPVVGTRSESYPTKNLTKNASPTLRRRGKRNKNEIRRVLRFGFFQIKKKKKTEPSDNKTNCITNGNFNYFRGYCWRTTTVPIRCLCATYSPTADKTGTASKRRSKKKQNKRPTTMKYVNNLKQLSFKTTILNFDDLRPVGQGRQTCDAKKMKKKASEGLYNLFMPKLDEL